MSSRSARIRAALTAIGVVLGVALLLGLVVLALGTTVGFVGGILFGGDGGSTVQGPNVEIDARVEDQSAVVTHSGGESADPAELAFEVNGDDRGTWADHAGSDADRVIEGDTVRIDGVAAGDELVVRWVGESGTKVLYDETL